MAAAIFLLTLCFAYLLLGTCAQFIIAVLVSDPLLHFHWQHLPFFIIIEGIFICLFFLSGFRRDTFVFLYPFLFTILLHLGSNLWHIMNILNAQNSHSIKTQQFFEFCSKDIFDWNLNQIELKCICIRSNNSDTLLVHMSCMRVKLLIELIQLMPFVSILLVLTDFYTFLLVTFVYVYEKRSLIDYLPATDEYDLA